MKIAIVTVCFNEEERIESCSIISRTRLPSDQFIKDGLSMMIKKCDKKYVSENINLVSKSDMEFITL